MYFQRAYLFTTPEDQNRFTPLQSILVRKPGVPSVYSLLPPTVNILTKINPVGVLPLNLHVAQLLELQAEVKHYVYTT